MDTGLKFWEIRKPKVDNIYDVGEYLIDHGFGYGMTYETDCVRYRVRLATEDLTVLKLLFPNIFIKAAISKGISDF